MKNLFWLDYPLILFKKDQILQLWPSTNLTIERKLNALTRLIILLTLLGYAFTKRLEFFVISLLTILGITLLYKKRQIKNKVVREAFSKKRKTDIKSDFFNIENDNYTQPTPNNPLGNVLLTDYIDNPKRPQAAPAYEAPVEKAINNSTMDPRLFLDLGDNLAFDRSMRNFYAMPNTKIPS